MNSDVEQKPMDWGSWQERFNLVWSFSVSKDERGTPKQLRGSVEFLLGAGSVLVIAGLIAGVLGGGGVLNQAVVVGAIGWFIGAVVAIRLYRVVKRQRAE